MIHRFTADISHVGQPQRFTYPFRYAPHPLTVIAARETQHYISTRSDWQDELRQGKMFGVLVVGLPSGETAFLAAFSGCLAGRNRHEFFVPPIYDMLEPNGYFRTEEREISLINQEILSLEQSPRLTALLEAASMTEASARESLSEKKDEMRKAKAERDALRSKGPLTTEDEDRLVRESQRQKADYKRLERHWQASVAASTAALKDFTSRIDSLKRERKLRSAALQTWLFRQFKLLNARGEEKDLIEIFRETPQGFPPAGAGECALPKLLQYAYLNGLRPLAFGEFWWGDSPKNEVRRHGNFYPSCQGKCAPILRHALQGLDVEACPSVSIDEPLKVIYEDRWLIAVDKPAGMLSVPGKETEDSVLSKLREMYPDADGPLLVHRLDMDTSGILLAAKTKAVHQMMQTLWEAREVSKRYVALLEGRLGSQEGEVSLPLSPDYYDRPRQKVDYENGKRAVTHYNVRNYVGNNTLVDLYPKTGRTHQLRVHCAHHDGLGHPIVGDALYGTLGKRLFLHAAGLEFVHPVTGKLVKIESEPYFLLEG